MDTSTKDHVRKKHQRSQTFSNEVTEKMLQDAISAYSRGSFQEALDGIEKILDDNSEQSDALHIKGVLLGQLGEVEIGIESIRKAITVQPNIAQFHTNIGNLYQQTGDFDSAESSHLRAIELNPEYADAFNNLGVVLRNQGKPEQAIARFKHAIALQPELAAAHNNLGNVFQATEEFSAAQHCYQSALRFNAHYLEAAISLGAVYQAQGLLLDAKNAYLAALQISANSVEAHNDLGLVYQKLGDLSQAISSFETALQENPNYAQAHVNMGMVLQEQGRVTNAISHFDAAIALEPDLAEAYNNYGNALKDQRLLVEALQMYERALEIRPYYASAFSNYLFTLNYIGNVSRKEIYQKHREWAARFAIEDENPVFPSVRKMRKGDKIRIGYVSRDFRVHSVGYFIENILSSHDKNRYEVYCYYDFGVQDQVTQRLQSYATQWRPIYGVADSAVVDLVKKDHIDILIDLSGHTGQNRLNVFGQRPAPVQMSYLGYPNTTGLRSIQYRITDQYADPIGTDAYYSERLVRMEHSFLSYSPPLDAPKVGGNPFAAQDRITFGSFNNIAKVTDKVIRIWSEILLGVENSRLILKSKSLVDDGVAEKLIAAFQSYGVNRSQLDVRGFVAGAANHLALYNEVDIALDPFPYNGTTTTLEALWMGVPVISLAGDRHCARVGVSILNNINETSLLADNSQEYILKAIELAQNPQCLIDFKNNLRSQLSASPIMRAKEFTQSYEGMLERIWQSHSGESKSADIDLSSDTLIVHTRDKVDIAVPNNIAHLSTYVLREQEGWFEDEVNFVNTYIQPGMQVIDVGANIGVYALAMARRVADKGRVWAFEPNFLSCRYLQRGVSANNFTRLELIQAGVSNEDRQAYLFSHNSETTLGKVSDEAIGEPVNLVRLDSMHEQWGKPSIDFIKIDVEGHELQVFEGAHALLQSCDPLIMYEFRSYDTHELKLVEYLQQQGYRSYRLIASLNLLIPVDVSGKMDSYWLNLFACSQEKAQTLEQQGMLVSNVDDLAAPEIQHGCWENALAKLPLGVALQEYWQEDNRSKDITQWEHYCTALDYYYTALEPGIASPLRYASLLQSLVMLTDLVADHATVPRMMSLAKVASLLGLRDTALMIVDMLVEEFENCTTIDISEPFLCLSKHFESIDPGADLSAWMYGCLLDFKERNYAFSSYFFPQRSKARLERLEQLGFLSCEMQRRKILIEMREGALENIEPNKSLQHVSPDNLNPLHWK